MRRGVELHEAGAGLIDVGGFSSRPGAVPVSADEQIGRIVPVVRALSQEHGIPTSIDANDAAVAEAALGAGACALNDISGLQADPSIADLAAREGAGLVLMHMRGTPETMASMTDYGDVVGDVREALERSYRQALDAGVQHENIVIDPGIGFAKTAAQSTVILARLEEFAAIGRPVFIGVSRKSFLGAVTGRAAAARLGETVAATLFAFDHGARIHRVHDAGEAAAALAVWQTLRGAEKRADS
ncbi:MAG: dihydropteroate synthase [Deltaproteobacteria bacterium]|nr:dihydropteroate synthase [Deltaproteobacteria bacterium]